MGGGLLLLTCKAPLTYNCIALVNTEETQSDKTKLIYVLSYIITYDKCKSYNIKF